MASRLIVVLIALCCVLASEANAAVTDGPFLDLKATLDPPPNPDAGIIITIHYPQDTYHYNPDINRIVKDRTRFWIEYEFTFGVVFPSKDVIGLAYHTWSDNSRTGFAEITTIYGLDPNASSPDSLSIMGIAPGETMGVEDERMIGASGTEYLAHTSLVSAVGDLPTLLPDFDLSPFTGDPNNLVFVFQTTMPLDDMDVPEPGMIALLIPAGLVLLRRGVRVGAKGG